MKFLHRRSTARRERELLPIGNASAGVINNYTTKAKEYCAICHWLVRVTAPFIAIFASRYQRDTHSRPKHVFTRVYMRIGFSVRSTATLRFAKADLIKPSGLRHAGRCLLGMCSASPRVINKDIVIGSPRDLQWPDEIRGIF